MELHTDPPLSTSSPAGTQPPAAGNRAPDPGNRPPAAAGCEAPAAGGALQGKRLKELENTALQTSIIARMEEEEEAGGGAPRPGLDLQQQPASEELQSGEQEEENPERKQEEERSLTDHLNQRLLTSFLEKLNRAELTLPGLQGLHCPGAEEDSNRAGEEW